MGKPVLHFWGGYKMKMHTLHYILAYHGLQGEVDVVGDIPAPAPFGDGVAWAAYAPKGPTGSLPCMVTAGGAILGESMAIVRYVCRHLKLDTALSDEDFAQSEYLLETTNEVYLALNKAHYSPGGRTEAMDALFKPGGMVHKLLASLDARVGPAGWLGPQGVPTPGDLALCAALHILAGLQPDVLDAHPKVKARYDAVHAIESIAHVNRTYPALYHKRTSD